MSSSAQAPPKKPYQKPELRVHGNVQTLTAAIGMSAMNLDGGGGASKQTA